MRRQDEADYLDVQSQQRWLQPPGVAAIDAQGHSNPHVAVNWTLGRRTMALCSLTTTQNQMGGLSAASLGTQPSIALRKVTPRL